MSILRHRPVLTVDLSALSQNLTTLRRLARGAEVTGVVKANAYGLGATEIARTLYSDGVRTFFVVYADEAAEIVGVGGFADATFYVLNGPMPDDAPLYKDGRILPVLNSLDQAALWKSMGGGPCGIAIDIGMNRLGTSLSGALSIANILGPRTIRHVVMHLSHSGDGAAPENLTQRNLYTDYRAALQAALPDATYSLDASGGLLLQHDVSEEICRPGAALYGLSPTGMPSPELAPVATLTAPVVMLRSVASGQGVGYNSRWRASRPTNIAVLGIGYADGYSRSFANRGFVYLGSSRCPVVGAISMDLVTVDVTEAPDLLELGDLAEIYGPRIPIDEAAGWAGTIGYELQAAIGPRVRRRYINT